LEPIQTIGSNDAASASGLVQVRHLAAALTASKMLAEQNRREVLAETINEVGGVQDALRGVAYGLAVHKGDLHALPVSALMTKEVIACSPTDSVAQVASTMLARNVRHLPVEDESRLVGMISIRDVLNVRVAELQQQTSKLRSFANQTDRDPQGR
jgi:signal-transduction protein with cAMP-binding, CBS, and nucleotidyltransferase domain